MDDGKRLRAVYDNVTELAEVDLTGFSDVSAADWHDFGYGAAEVFASHLVEEGWPAEQAAEFGSMIAGPVVSVLSSASGRKVSVLQIIEKVARVGVGLGVTAAFTRRLSRDTAQLVVNEHLANADMAKRLTEFSSGLESL